MRAVVQRVKSAKVGVSSDIIGEIEKGLLVFLGIGKGDDQKDADYLLSKIIELRIFEDQDNKFNLSLLDVNGSILVISQFTLYGDCRRGRRPSFVDAAEPEEAERLYQYLIEKAKKKGIKVACGKFQAMMDIQSLNYGPVTILLDSKKLF